MIDVSVIRSTLFLTLSVLITICVIDNPALGADVKGNNSFTVPRSTTLRTIDIDRVGDATQLVNSYGMFSISSMVFLLGLVGISVLQIFQAARLVLV